MGPAGQNAVNEFAFFYALMPPDNAATVPGGEAVDFPRDGANSGEIVRVDNDEFLLPETGVYEVSWQVSVGQKGQLVLALNGVEQPQTVAGRSQGNTQITNTVIIETSAPNTVLSVRNPTGNSPALAATPSAGGDRPVAASLVIKRLL